MLADNISRMLNKNVLLVFFVNITKNVTKTFVEHY